MVKKIGLRYCGGCNPRYDRKKLVTLCEQEFLQVRFEPFQIGKVYQGIAIVCGCKSGCAEKQDLPKTMPWIFVDNQDDRIQLANFLNHLGQEN